MNYPEAIAFLNRCINYERLGFEGLTHERHLEDFASFLERLGAPHRSLKCLHIAGTKGKGSTAWMLAVALENCGFRTGLFTSPHIEDYTERIKVGLRDIPCDEFGRLLSEVVDQYPPEKQSDRAGFRTVFELLTAMALCYFRECRVQVAVMETGLGGRLDATNVIVPEVSVITTLGIEHTETLGDTIDLITGEKAGIIKPGRPVVVSQQSPQWADRIWPVLERTSIALHSPLIRAEGRIPFIERRPEAHPGSPQQLIFQEFLGHAAFEIELPLPGMHQALNLQTALAVLDQMSADGWLLDAAQVQAGLRKASLPGRVEVFGLNPPVVLDGAHCPASFRALLQTLEELFPKRPLIFLTGLARRKRRDDIFDLLVEDARTICIMFYPLPNPRTENPSELADAARSRGLQAEAFDSLENCLQAAGALQAAVSGAVLVGAGSFYGLAPLRRALLKTMALRSRV